jgi:hypothetical protein
MACKSCGNEAASEQLCMKCGQPEVDENSSRLLRQASDYLTAGEPDRAIRNIQPVIRSVPGSFLAHYLLADAYQRKAKQEKSLRPFALREYNEALKLLPPDREAHVALIGLAGRVRELDALEQAYPEKARDLPFAAECRKMIGAALFAGEPTEVGPFRLTNYVSRRALVILALCAAGVAATYYLSNSLFTADTGNNAGNAKRPETYVPGTNLIINGDAAGEWMAWTHPGKTTIIAETNPFFRIAGTDGEEGEISQQVPLPVSHPPYLLVLARTRAAISPPDEMSGLPNIWGNIQDGKGRVLTWLQEYNLLHRAPAGEWGVSWGVIEIPPDAASLTVVLQQALKAGGTRAGNSADFDNVGAYLFSSIVTAREYAEQYNGEPPQGRFQETAVPESAPAAKPQMPSGYTSMSTDRDLNLKAAKAVFDALSPGMSVEEAGNITGMDSRSSAWSQDFGLSMKPSCITLITYFKEDKVFRTEVRSCYDADGRSLNPGTLILEKGAAYEEVSR